MFQQPNHHNIEPLEDPTGRLQRELDGLLVQISERRQKIMELQDQGRALEQEKVTVENLSGWKKFNYRGDSPMALKLRIKQVNLKLQGEQRTLNEIQSSYQELITPLYAKGTVWTFAEVDHFIIRLLHHLNKEAEQGGLLVSVPNERLSMQQKEAELQKLDIDATKVFGAFKAAAGFLANPLLQFVDSKRGSLANIKVYRLTLYLDQLYAERRNLLPTLLMEIPSWDTVKIKTELHKRERELKETGGHLVGLYTQISGAINIRDPFDEQRKFLEELIGELRAAWERSNAPLPPPPPRDLAAEKIARIAELQRKMEEALKSNPRELSADIKRVYGQLIDEERKKR